MSGTTVSSTYQVANPNDVTKTITFQLDTNDPDGSGPCPVVSKLFNVTINMAARVSAPVNLALCRDTPSINLGATSGGSTQNVVWSGGTGSFIPNNTTLNASYKFNDPTEVNTTVVLTLKALDPDGSGPCGDVTTNVNLKINLLPNVGFSISGAPNNNIANNDPPATLNGFQSGGVFSSLPSTAPVGPTTQTPFDVAQFDPSVAPVGVNTITYTFTDANQCTNSTSQNLNVTQVTTINFYLKYSNGSFLSQDFTKNWGEYNYEVCAEIGTILLDGQPFNNDPYTRFDIQQPTNAPFVPNLASHLQFAGGNWTLDTNNLPAGSYDIIYYYRDANGTPAPKIRTLDVLAHPIAKINVNSTCVTSGVIVQSASSMPVINPFFGSITGYDWDLDDDIHKSHKIDTAYYNQPGKKLIQLVVTTNRNCTARDTTSIKVGDFPIPDFSWSSICTFDQTNFVDQTTFKVGGTITNYDWDFGDGGVFNGPLVNKTVIHSYTTNGTYQVKMTVTTDVGCVQSITKPVDILITTTGTQVPSTTQSYFENFDSSNGGWITEAFNATNSTSTNKIPSKMSWMWGLPGGNFNQGQGTNGWWTGANNNSYYDFESSAVNGPCFDLTQLTRPMIALDYWIDANENYDGAVLQYSVDGGISWTDVGPLAGTSVPLRDQGISWYNPGATIVGNPGNQNSGPYGWTGRGSKWLNGRFSLDLIPNDTILINSIKQPKRKQVRVRIAYASNGPAAGTATYGGFAFDNVFVGEKKRTALIEHFVNAVDYANSSESFNSDKFIQDRHLDQQNLHKGVSDFIDIQYHARFPKPDIFDSLNRWSGDFSARASFYQTQKVPYSLMDGDANVQPQLAFPKGDYQRLSTIEIDRRSLVDPEVSLINFIDNNAADTTKMNISLDIVSQDTIDYPLLANVALVEKSVVVNYSKDPTQNGVHHNVVRKLLFGNGKLIIQNFNPGDVMTINSGDVTVDVVIINPDSLLLVAFVQNFYSKEILQSSVISASRKTGAIVTAIEGKRTLSADNVVIYPNPANSSFNFGLPGDFPTECTWKLSDQHGVCVLSGGFQDAANGKKEVNISELTNGLYIVTIEAPGQNPVYKKLIVLNSN